jgi:DNA-binding response OmpR family regulator
LYKLLIADDEPDVVSLIKDFFELKGYLVLTARDGAEAVAAVSQAPDVILLDINMPEMDGISVCRSIRDKVSCPIVFLTARIEDADKVAGFTAGGDDYVVKPFSLAELGARVEAHIRRDHRETANHNLLTCGSLTVDLDARTVTSGDQEISLAKKEYQIIELLAVNAGQVYDKERIYERIWGYDAEGDSAVVAEHIRRIRAKLAKYGEEKHIETVWGMGYKWVK